MAWLTGAERDFVTAVSQLAYGNPFLPERIEWERRALGGDHVRFDAVWHAGAEAVGQNPNETRIAERAAALAELLRDRLAADGLQAWPKTSGNKGAQLYVPIDPPASGSRTSDYAKRLAAELSREHGDLVVATMSKQARPGKVYIDWSQNNPAKTTIAPYSLRGTERPQVSTPLHWDEVADVRRAADLVFTPDDVVGRLEEYGDLLGPMRDSRQRLPED